MIKVYLPLFLLAFFCFSSCDESPKIDFHSFQELSQYDFIRNGWFPEILQNDACNIQETYDINNKHIFGKFDFIEKSKYDSIISTCLLVPMDSLIEHMEKINKPKYPQWFIPKDDLKNSRYTVVKQKEFYLIIERDKSRIYYVR
jgi:hypothetical protein